MINNFVRADRHLVHSLGNDNIEIRLFVDDTAVYSELNLDDAKELIRYLSKEIESMEKKEEA